MDNFRSGEGKGLRKRSGNMIAGLLLLVVGGALVLRELDHSNVIDINLNENLFRWPMIVIMAGIFIGAVNRFRDFGWLLISAVGLFFQLEYWWPEIQVKDYIVPAVIIIIGLALLLRPRFNYSYRKWKEHAEDAESLKAAKNASKEDVLDVAAVFGAVKKNLYSKSFKGGEIVSVFGGVEIDLSQADFEGKVVIESVQIFGGATLIVPPTWQVRSEAVAVFGGIEDKRKHVVPTEPQRVLVLDGFALFGGIEIKSY